MKELILKVEGMHCNGCKERIQNAILNMENIESVIADYKKGTVKIKSSEDLKINLITELIEDLGFNIKEG